MRLLSVHFEEKLLLYERCDTLAHSFGGSRTFAEDDSVIGITHERQTAAFKFAVKFRQHYVAQYRTQWASLRYALSVVFLLVTDHNSCIEILVYQRYDTAVFDCFAHQLYQRAVADCVKELLKVKVYAVFIVIVDDFLRFLQCLVCTPSRAEAVA